MPTATKHRRPTKVEQAARVGRVVDLILSGAGRVDVLQYAAETWGIRTRQADALLALAYRRIEGNLERRAGRLLNLTVARCRALYARTLAAGDLRAALRVLEFEADLLGLYPGARPDFRQLSDRDIDRELADLTEETSPHPGAGRVHSGPGPRGESPSPDVAGL